jgi:uncharacterized protein (DUF1501 family)
MLPWLPRLANGTEEPAATLLARKSLVLVELNGGNDGLNTVVPFVDPEYSRLRPKLAIQRNQVLKLDEHLGLHPALEPLMPAWQDAELAWVLGVGYAQPNRSHFRSIDIWETASDSEQVLHQGWVARSLPVPQQKQAALPDVVVLGGDDGPLQGGTLQVISLQKPESFTREAARLETAQASDRTPDALAHILAVRQAVSQAGIEFQHYLDNTLKQDTLDFPKTALGQQLHQVARMLLAGMNIPVFKVRIGSFDTHNNQQSRHRQLLTQLAESLAVFRQTLRKAGLWNDVLIMSYSEFGRRAAENASQGTDHGTAAPHFILGGRVKGGLFGEQPSLHQLEKGDLRHTVDYRQLYTTVAQRWWNTEVDWQQRFPALDFI